MAEIDISEFQTEPEIRAAEAEKKFIRAGNKFEMGDLDEALMLIRSSLSLCPGNPKYHYNAGFLYWRKGLLGVAINHYKLFVRYAPANDENLMLIKGRIKYLENETQQQMKRK